MDEAGLSLSLHFPQFDYSVLALIIGNTQDPFNKFLLFIKKSINHLKP